MMLLRTLVVGMIQTNCYVVGSELTHEAAIIDPGGDAEDIMQTVADLEVRVGQIILTHYHFDHCLAAEAVRQATGARLLIHTLDAPFLADPPAIFRMASPQTPVGLVADRLLEDGEHLSVGELDLAVLHTPGHSPGGIALYIASEHILFSGDALFREGLGRTDFPGWQPRDAPPERPRKAADLAG